jgi:hypothetical protein
VLLLSLALIESPGLGTTQMICLQGLLLTLKMNLLMREKIITREKCCPCRFKMSTLLGGKNLCFHYSIDISFCLLR